MGKDSTVVITLMFRGYLGSHKSRAKGVISCVGGLMVTGCALSEIYYSEVGICRNTSDETYASMGT
jgi:hypothetical protein